MKIKKIILCVSISLLMASTGFAQKKIGVFIHGFSGNSDKWLVESKAPQSWKTDGIIDEYVALDYETLELETQQSQAALLLRFDQIMSTKGSKQNDEWILVGHSLGGIVARVLYPALRNQGYNVVAVVSVGGPSQGAEATNVSTTLISSSFNRIKSKFVEAQKHVPGHISFALSWQALLSSGPSIKSQIEAIPDMMDVARDSALGYASIVIESKAASLIGREGSVIKTINGYSVNNQALHPQNYLSIIGAEKSKIPFRIAGHIFESDEFKDEYNNIKDLTDLRNNYFSLSEGWYRQLAKRYQWCRMFASCRSSRDYAHYRENLWKQAKLEIDNIDVTWGQLINSYRFVTTQISVYYPPCPGGEDPGPNPFPGPVEATTFFDLGIDPGGSLCSTNPNGEYGYETVEVKYADKNDGVVNIHSVLWSANSQLDDLHNRYMKDVEYNGSGNDIGGYNHFELRNYKRDYVLKDQNGAVIFDKNTKNPSMLEAANWIGNLGN